MERKQEIARLLARARSGRWFGGWPRLKSSRSIELYLERGDNFRRVSAEIDGDHLKFETHDMGPATEEFWGDSDYEFWTVVNRSQWPTLLAAYAKDVGLEGPDTEVDTWRSLTDSALARLLLDTTKAMFEGESRATDRVRDLCDRHGVEYSGGSWV